MASEEKKLGDCPHREIRAELWKAAAEALKLAWYATGTKSDDVYDYAFEAEEKLEAARNFDLEWSKHRLRAEVAEFGALEYLQTARRESTWKATANSLDSYIRNGVHAPATLLQIRIHHHAMLKAARQPDEVVVSDKDKKSYCICYGHDDNWLSGPFETVEAARAEMLHHAGEYEDLRVHHVRCVHPTDYLPSIGEVLEWMDEQVYGELSPECDFGPIHEVADEEGARDALSAWAEKYIATGHDMLTGARVDREGGAS